MAIKNARDVYTRRNEGTEFAERLGSYVSLQATLREQVPDIDYVDVRFGDRVYVGVAEPAGAARAKRRVAGPARDASARLQP